MPMTKRKRQTPAPQVQRFAPVIQPIPDAPGPEASAEDLDANYRLVQVAIATHSYDDHIILCHWCLADTDLTHTKVDQPRGVHSYCSERCALAFAAYQKRLARGAGPMTTTPAPMAPAPDDEDEALAPLVAGGANGDDVPLSEIAEVIGEEGQGRSEGVTFGGDSLLNRTEADQVVTGDAPAWKPKGQRSRKRSGGNGNGDKTHCLLGHEMTEENTYNHPNGTKKCRRCQSERLARMRGKS